VLEVPIPEAQDISMGMVGLVLAGPDAGRWHLLPGEPVVGVETPHSSPTLVDVYADANPRSCPVGRVEVDHWGIRASSPPMQELLKQFAEATAKGGDQANVGSVLEKLSKKQIGGTMAAPMLRILAWCQTWAKWTPAHVWEALRVYDDDETQEYAERVPEFQRAVGPLPAVMDYREALWAMVQYRLWEECVQRGIEPKAVLDVTREKAMGEVNTFAYNVVIPKEIMPDTGGRDTFWSCPWPVAELWSHWEPKTALQ